MEQQTNTTTAQQPESSFSLLEIWQTVKAYGWVLIKFSWLIAGLSIGLGYYLYQRKIQQSTVYTATLTFMLSEDNVQQGVLGNLLGFRGMDMNSGNGSINLSKLEELLMTRKISQMALFHRATIRLYPDQSEREDFIINHYLRLKGYPESAMFKTDSLDLFSRSENERLLSVHGQITREGLKKYISPSGIFNMNFTSTSEEFAYEFLNVLYNQLDSYYFESSIRKQKLLAEAAETRCAKLKGEVVTAENAYADYKNKNNRAAAGQHYDGIQTQYLARDLQVKMEAYFSAVRAAEAAQVALREQGQLIELIDPPIYPLAMNAPNGFVHLMLGLLAGAVLGLVLVLGGKFAYDFIQKEAAKNAQKK